MSQSESSFSFDQAHLASIASRVLDIARDLGATSAEAEVSEGYGQGVSVRLGEVETIEYNRDKGVGITVYLGQSKGNASTSDFGDQALRDTVVAALNIARYTAADDCAGLADPALLARDVQDLDLCHPWELSVERAIDIAREIEDAGRAVDPRISNSEGASVNTHASQFVYANSNGFSNGYASSRHSLSAALIAESGDSMQRDYWYSTARAAGDLEAAATVGRIAGERTVRRLDARRVKTCQVPVLFDPGMAAGLIGQFVSAVSGGSLYRKSSFLLDSLGQPVFSDKVNISEDPFIRRGLASGCFDNEGVATRAREVVQGGVLNGYFLSSYSARKLGMQSTGNAGGCHNLIVHSTGESFDELLKAMGTGLLVTELLGHGINMVTGDYSRGAAGFWVENGQIVHPVEEITVAGNLKQMFLDVAAVGADVLVRGSKQTGSILISRMTVAGE